MLRQLAACGAGAVGGVAFGVTYSELTRAAFAKLSPSTPAIVDAGDPKSLVAAAVRLANEAGGLCVLSKCIHLGLDEQILKQRPQKHFANV